MSFCNQCGTELPDGANFCTNCGAAVTIATAGADRRASDPGAPVGDRSPQSDFTTRAAPQPIVAGARGAGWILPALVAVAVLIIGYLLLTPRATDRAERSGAAVAAADGEGTSERAGADRRAVDDASDAASVAGANTRGGASVSAAVLDSAFNSDPAGAAQRYPGPVRVSGTIATMVQPGRTPSLSLEGRTRFNFMIVEFPEGYRTRLAPLAKGQFVSVACDQVRALGGTTILSGCLLT
jgi:hypothetical protein